MLLLTIFWLLISIGAFIRYKPELEKGILNFLYLIIFSIIAPPIMIGIVITDYVIIRVQRTANEDLDN